MNVRRALLAACMAMAAAGGCASDGGSAATVGPDVAAVEHRPSDRFAKRGFVTFVDDGRLWVFREGSEAAADYRRGHEPRRSITLIGRGPNGMAVRSVDRETIEAYLAAK